MAALLTEKLNDYSLRMASVNGETKSQESVWIDRARQSDARAFESLYRVHIDRVYGLCLRMTGNTSEAEDCAQETFIQAWKKLQKFRGDSAFSTWLHRIAVNTVLGRIRKSKREQERLLSVADTTALPTVTSESGELSDLSAAIERLPLRARHVFVLYAVYGYSHDEAAAMLGIASGTSKAQLHRAKNLLAQQLRQQGFGT